jgi:large subunit ribosomal protein L25
VQVTITGEPRTDFGKGAARRLRRSGMVPAVIYGRGAEVEHVSLPEHDLALALKKPKVVLEVTVSGTPHVVAPRQVQRDPVRLVIEHVDLVSIDATEARARSLEAKAIAEAEVLAEERGLDPVAVAAAVSEAIEAGVDADKVVETALTNVAESVAAQAEQAAAEGAAEDAAAAIGAEGGTVGETSTDTVSDEG